MTAISIGLVSAGMLAVSAMIGSPLGSVLTDLCDLAAIVGVIVSVGLLEGV